MTKEEGQVIQWQKKKDRQYNDKRRRTGNTMTKERITIYKILHRKLKIEQDNPTKTESEA